MTSSRIQSRISGKISLLLLCLLLIGSSVSRGQAHDKSDELFEAMAFQAGSWVADVGSGSGHLTVPMAERVGPSGRVFAVDIDPDALEKLNETLTEHEIEHVTSVYSVEDNPMLPAKSLDAMLIRNTYHHFTARQSMLRHIKAALKRDGRVVIEESVHHDMVGKPRAEQVKDHNIGIGYVREELKAAGFAIEKEVNPFVEADSHFHWMIIATRPDS